MASRKRQSLIAFAKHTSVQGEIVHAANRLQSDFFLTFVIAISLGRAEKPEAMFDYYDHALAIWHVIQSDSAQRQMAFEAIATVPTKLNLANAIDRIRWAKAQADTLASGRNIVAHNPVTLRPRVDGARGLVHEPEFGSLSSRPAHQRRLDLIRGLKFWQALRDDLLKLSDYMSAINDYVLKDRFVSWGHKPLSFMPSAWPRRPRLQSVAQLRAIDSQLQAATQKTRRRIPRRPSRG